MRTIVIIVTVDGNTSTSLGIGVQVDPARVPAQRELRDLIPLPSFSQLGQSTKLLSFFGLQVSGKNLDTLNMPGHSQQELLKQIIHWKWLSRFFWRKKPPPCEARQALFTVAAHGVVPVERNKYICKMWNFCGSLSLYIMWYVLMKESSWAGMCWATKLMLVSRTLWLRR